MLNSNISQKIELQLKKIIGLRFRKARRMAATGGIDFGEMKTIVNRKGETILVPQYAIHSSCSFRVVNENKCLLANLDMFNVNSITECDYRTRR